MNVLLKFVIVLVCNSYEV